MNQYCYSFCAEKFVQRDTVQQHVSISSRSYSRKIHKHIHREEAFCCSYCLLTRIRLIFILKQVNTKDGPLRSLKSKFHQWQYRLQPILTTDNKSMNPEIICWTSPLKQTSIFYRFCAESFPISVCVIDIYINIHTTHQYLQFQEVFSVQIRICFQHSQKYIH